MCRRLSEDPFGPPDNIIEGDMLCGNHRICIAKLQPRIIRGWEKVNINNKNPIREMRRREKLLLLISKVIKI